MLIPMEGAATMTSREIADLTEKSHGDVMRDIRGMLDSLGKDQSSFAGIYPDSYGRSQPLYRLPYEETICLLTGYDPVARMIVIRRWQELEAGAAPKLPQTMAQALRLAADQAEQLEAQQALIAQQQPAVEFVGRYVDATGLKGFREVAKLLKIKEPAFRTFLEEQKIMYRLGGEWTAYAAHIDAGRFQVRTGESETGHAFTSAKFTPKGVSWVAGEFAKWQVEF